VNAVGRSIPKGPVPDARAIRSLHPFVNARSAFLGFLNALQADADDIVLLPSYIGVSGREGSGVFDPIRRCGVGFAFYAQDADLHTDVTDFERQLVRLRPKVVVLIHYFGWPDPAYAELVRLAHERGVLVLEDSAHAMLSDIIGGIVGRLGDASIWSLHKLLPVPSGGLLLLNAPTRHLAKSLPPGAASIEDPLAHDLARMSERRRSKAAQLMAGVHSMVEELEPLRDELPVGVVPQTFPVRIRRVSRDRLYGSMNAAGFGVVSLYHTLIPEISRDTYPESHALSRVILNLPLHDSASSTDLDRLIVALGDHIASSAGNEDRW
jgi:dTDP-4-amino-4,6-dideoxygalactose transaminase